MKQENFELANQLMNDISRARWGEWLDQNDGATDSDKSEMSDYLMSLSTLAAEVAAYLDRRGGNGCGDSGHEKALSGAQKKRKAVRKALGYSYP